MCQLDFSNLSSPGYRYVSRFRSALPLPSPPSTCLHIPPLPPPPLPPTPLKFPPSPSCLIPFQNLFVPLFHCPASSTPLATFLLAFSTPVRVLDRPSPTGLPIEPVAPVMVSPMPRPAAPVTPLRWGQKRERGEGEGRRKFYPTVRVMPPTVFCWVGVC